MNDMLRSQEQEGDQEKLIWEGTYSAKGAVNYSIGVILLTLALLIVPWFLPESPLKWLIVVIGIVLAWLFLAGLVAYRKLSVRYRLTTQRLIHESGILTRHTDRIELIDVDDVSHTQGVVERLLGVGTLEVTSSDVSHPRISLPGLDDVERLAGLMDDARRQERRRRGLHIESI